MKSEVLVNFAQPEDEVNYGNAGGEQSQQGERRSKQRGEGGKKRKDEKKNPE